MESVVKEDTIYVYPYSDKLELFWVGNMHDGGFFDKQYNGQLYKLNDLPKEIREMSLEEAVKNKLIKRDRFVRMNVDDKRNTVIAMIKLKGLATLIDFLSNDKLNLSDDEIRNLLN